MTETEQMKLAKEIAAALKGTHEVLGVRKPVGITTNNLNAIVHLRSARTGELYRVHVMRERFTD